MPIHEYTCAACGSEFEILILARSPAARCPSCDSDELVREVSGFAVSSDATRRTSLHRAKRTFAASADHVDKQMAVQDAVRDHFAEDGVKLPPRTKPK